jgi:acyl-coenzyme A thioesterase 13
MEDSAKQRFADLFTRGGFDRALVGLELLDVREGHAKVRLPVGDAVKNLGGKLHGGAIATLVDDVGTIAILATDRQGRPGVSTDLNVSFFAPGEGAVIAEAQVLKAGKTLAFVSVDIRREQDGVLVAQGRMTKHLG